MFDRDFLSGAVVSEGGSHWFESYERIIEAYGGISAPPVQVMQLDQQGSQQLQDFWNHRMSAYLNTSIRYSQSIVVVQR